MNFGIDPAVSTAQVRPFRPGRSSYFPIIRTDTVDPEELLVKAREQYEKDKALREEVIRNRSKNNSN